MNLLKAKIPPNCDVVLHGDTHWGTVASHEKAVRRLIDWVRRGNNRFFVHMGDEIEAITVDDKRFQFDTEGDAVPLQQIRFVYDMYYSVSKRCLAWLYGNHTDSLRRFGNLTEELCRQLDVPYGGWTTKLKLEDKQGQIVKLYLTHKVRGRLYSNAKDYEQQIANMKASLKLMLQNKASDCLIMGAGHTHQLLIVDPSAKLLLTDDGEDLHQRYLQAGDGASDYIQPDSRWYVSTGSFLRTFAVGVDTYSEKAGYDPVELGYVIVKIRDRKVVAVEKKIV